MFDVVCKDTAIVFYGHMDADNGYATEYMICQLDRRLTDAKSPSAV